MSKPAQEQEDFIFTVLENGLDFLLNALAHLRGQPSPRQLKYAVLHLSAGLLLVLKDRLRREHWALVFADVNKADEKAYQTGDFVSVDFTACLKRLADVCRVQIPERERQAIASLKAKRNRLEHCAAVDSASAIKALAAKVLGFSIDFIASQYGQGDLQPPEAAILVDIRGMLPEFEQFVAERMAAIQGDLAAAELPLVECPACLQEAVILGGGLSCKFCGYSASADDGAEDYVKSLFGVDWKHVADGGELHIYRCPECWGESLVDIGTLKQDYRGERMVCFDCGQAWTWEESDFCAKCGSPMQKSEDGLTICSDCFAAA